MSQKGGINMNVFQNKAETGAFAHIVQMLNFSPGFNYPSDTDIPLTKRHIALEKRVKGQICMELK